MISTVDPVQLTGEGEYNLDRIIQEEVTESFLGLDQAVKECQNEEHYVECTTNNYIQDMRQQCGCLPLSIRAIHFQVNGKSNQTISLIETLKTSINIIIPD